MLLLKSEGINPNKEYWIHDIDGVIVDHQIGAMIGTGTSFFPTPITADWKDKTLEEMNGTPYVAFSNGVFYFCHPDHDLFQLSGLNLKKQTGHALAGSAMTWIKQASPDEVFAKVKPKLQPSLNFQYNPADESLQELLNSLSPYTKPPKKTYSWVLGKSGLTKNEEPPCTVTAATPF